MRKSNGLVGMFFGLAISLVLVPMIGLAALDRDATISSSENTAMTVNTGLYSSYISSYSRDASEEGRTETAQDILKDYRNYLRAME